MGVTVQKGGMDDSNSKVIAFVVNTNMSVTVDYIYIYIHDRSVFVWSIYFVQLKVCWLYIANIFLKFRVIDGEYIVNLSRGIAKHFYEVMPWMWDIKSFSYQFENKSVINSTYSVYVFHEESKKIQLTQHKYNIYTCHLSCC